MRCHEKTVRRMLNRGEICGERFAGRWLMHERDLPTNLPQRPPPTGRRRPRHEEGIASEAVRELEERLAS